VRHDVTEDDVLLCITCQFRDSRPATNWIM